MVDSCCPPPPCGCGWARGGGEFGCSVCPSRIFYFACSDVCLCPPPPRWVWAGVGWVRVGCFNKVVYCVHFLRSRKCCLQCCFGPYSLDHFWVSLLLLLFSRSFTWGLTATHSFLQTNAMIDRFLDEIYGKLSKSWKGQEKL